jgi:hypothetical protein
MVMLIPEVMLLYGLYGLYALYTVAAVTGITDHRVAVVVLLPYVGRARSCG